MGDVAGVAIALNMDGAPFTIGASNALARDVDLIQYQASVPARACTPWEHGVGMYVPGFRPPTIGGASTARGPPPGVQLCWVFRCRSSSPNDPKAVFKVYADRGRGLTRKQRDMATATAPEIDGGFALVGDHIARQAQQIDGQALLLDGQGQLTG